MANINRFFQQKSDSIIIDDDSDNDISYTKKVINQKQDELRFLDVSDEVRDEIESVPSDEDIYFDTNTLKSHPRPLKCVNMKGELRSTEEIRKIFDPFESFE